MWGISQRRGEKKIRDYLNSFSMWSIANIQFEQLSVTQKAILFQCLGISLIIEMNNPAPPALFWRAAAHDMKGLNLEDQQKQFAEISVTSFFFLLSDTRFLYWQRKWMRSRNTFSKLQWHFTASPSTVSDFVGVKKHQKLMIFKVTYDL